MSTARTLVTILTLALGVTTAAHAAPTPPAAAPGAPVAKAAAKATKGAKGSKKAPVGAAQAPAAGAPAPGDKAAGADKAAAAPNTSPITELKRSNAQLDKVLKRNTPNWSPEAELQRAEVRKVVGAFLDYGELAHRALARHWDTLTPKQREDFTETLRELVERSYLKQIHGSPNYNIKYDKEQKTGNEAVVDATLSTTSRGKKVEVALQYKMLGKGDHWVVYDVLTDEQSMLENYRAEFNKIISKDGFDALLKRMKKKLDEKEE
jgi:phospholipid transport system substrate-binding protein